MVWRRAKHHARAHRRHGRLDDGGHARRSSRRARRRRTGSGDETSQYAYWLMKAHPDWEVVNQGINAQRSDVIAARFEEDVIAKKPAVVVIIAGVNDVYQGRPAQHVKDQLAAMYKRAHDAGIRVVAGTIIPYNTATADQNARMRDINDWIRTQGARRSRRHLRRYPRRRRRAGRARQARQLPRRPAPRRRGLPQDGGRHRAGDQVALRSSRIAERPDGSARRHEDTKTQGFLCVLVS